MVNDLFQQQLVGMSRIEIDELLGIPPRTGYFSICDYVYSLGPERGLIAIDSEWLCIRFDKEIVVEVRVMRD